MGQDVPLTRDWWRETEPDGLGRAGRGFERAVVHFEKAERRLRRRPTAKRLWLYEKAVDEIEDEAKDVRRALKKLGDTASDAREKTAIKRLAALLGSPLADRLKAAMEVAEEIGDRMEEDADEVFGDAEAHKAYFKRMANRLKREPHNFGLALPSQDPEDMRFRFDKIKPARTLGLAMRKGLGAQRFTYGIAGGERLAQELGITDLEPRTLLLYLEGRTLPGLQLRVRRLLRALSVSGFSRVRVVAKGTVIGGEADEDFVDTMRARGLDDGTIQALLDGRKSGPGRSAPPGVAVALRRRIWGALPAIKRAPGAKARKLAAMAKSASEMVETRNYETATQMIERVERELARLHARGQVTAPRARPKSAKAPPPGKPDIRKVKA